jgi:hypothetical protein
MTPPTTEFQTDSGSNISTIAVRREIGEMGFHGRAASHKPKITMHKAKRRLEWHKTRCYWTLETCSLDFLNMFFIFTFL